MPSIQELIQRRDQPEDTTAQLLAGLAGLIAGGAVGGSPIAGLAGAFGAAGATRNEQLAGKQRTEDLLQRRLNQVTGFVGQGFSPESSIKAVDANDVTRLIKPKVGYDPLEVEKFARDQRKDYESHPTIQNYTVINDLASKIGAVWQNFLDNPDNPSLNALDQTLITSLGKALDPGSVVRESEYARTPQGVSVLNRLSGYVEKIGSGGSGITDEDREDIINTFRKLEEGQRSVANTYRDEVVSRVKRSKVGVDYKDVARPIVPSVIPKGKFSKKLESGRKRGEEKVSPVFKWNLQDANK